MIRKFRTIRKLLFFAVLVFIVVAGVIVFRRLNSDLDTARTELQQAQGKLVELKIAKADLTAATAAAAIQKDELSSATERLNELTAALLSARADLERSERRVTELESIPAASSSSGNAVLRQAVGQFALVFFGNGIWDHPDYIRLWNAMLLGETSMEFVYDPATGAGTLNVPLGGDVFHYQFSTKGREFRMTITDKEGNITGEFSSG